VPESGGLTGLTSAFRSAIIQPAWLSDTDSVTGTPTEITEAHGYRQPIVGSTGLGSSFIPATASSGLLTSHTSRLSSAFTQNQRSAPANNTLEESSASYHHILRKPSTGVKLPSRSREAKSLPLLPLGSAERPSMNAEG
jgi:hypothetical protein